MNITHSKYFNRYPGLVTIPSPEDSTYLPLWDEAIKDIKAINLRIVCVQSQINQLEDSIENLNIIWNNFDVNSFEKHLEERSVEFVESPSILPRSKDPEIQKYLTEAESSRYEYKILEDLIFENAGAEILLTQLESDAQKLSSKYTSFLKETQENLELYKVGQELKERLKLSL